MGGSGQNDEVRESIVDQLNETLSNQIDSRAEVERKATQVLTADLLTISIVVGLYSRDYLSVFVLASVFSLVVSILFCSLTFSPKTITLGMGTSGATAARDMDAGPYYDQLIDELGDFIDQNKKVKQQIANNLERSIWASFSGILFLIAAGLELHLPGEYRAALYVPGLFVVPTIAMYAKDEAWNG